jgi:hypothetical protein
LLASKVGSKRPVKITAADAGRHRADDGHVVSTDHPWKILWHQCRDGDIIRNLGILRNENVPGAELKLTHLLTCRRRIHELQPVCDVVVVVDINVVAETYGNLVLYGLLIYVTDRNSCDMP